MYILVIRYLQLNPTLLSAFTKNALVKTILPSKLHRMKPDNPLIHAITYCYSTIPNVFPLNARTSTLKSSLPYALHPLVLDLIHSATQN